MKYEVVWSLSKVSGGFWKTKIFQDGRLPTEYQISSNGKYN